MTWLLHKKSIRIYYELLANGILVAAPKRGNVVPEGVSPNSFVLGDRTLTFFHPDTSNQYPPPPNRPEREIVDRIGSFLEKILYNNKKIQFYLKIKAPIDLSTENQRKAEKAKKLGQIWGTREGPYVYSSRNKNHHTEIFLPVTYSSLLDPDITIGSYIFPWSSNATKFKFNKITKYVMAGCLGGTITGYDQKEGEHLLIKHDLDFFDNQKIVEVSDSAESPYDKVLFHEFEKMASLITNLGEGRELFYHMPYYDYALFGIKLYVQGRISNEALDQFLECIFTRKERHIEKIQDISKKYGININIQSPFEKLFSTTVNNTVGNFISNIREVFKDFLKEPEPKPDKNTENTVEKALVDFCLNRLLTDIQTNNDHQQVWRDFIPPEKITGIQNIEELFKIANAIIIGIASKGEKENQVCSILPVSEKPIQIEYAKYINEYQNVAEKYGHVLNLTVLDSVASYCPGKRSKSGLLFYNHNQEDTLAEVMDDSTLYAISKNVKAFAENAPPDIILLPDTIASPEIPAIKGNLPEPALSPAINFSYIPLALPIAPFPKPEKHIPVPTYPTTPNELQKQSQFILSGFAL